MKLTMNVNKVTFYGEKVIELDSQQLKKMENIPSFMLSFMCEYLCCSEEK